MGTIQSSKNVEWEAKKKRLLKKYSFLDESDLSYRRAGEEEMMEQLQIKLCVSREALDQIISKI